MVVVVWGAAERAPLAGTLAPFKVTEAAFVVVHVRGGVGRPGPGVGDTDKLAVGGGVAGTVGASGAVVADVGTVTVTAMCGGLAHPARGLVQAP